LEVCHPFEERVKQGQVRVCVFGKTDLASTMRTPFSSLI
jgi:hypothetical protein